MHHGLISLLGGYTESIQHRPVPHVGQVEVVQALERPYLGNGCVQAWRDVFSVFQVNRLYQSIIVRPLVGCVACPGSPPGPAMGLTPCDVLEL